MVSKCMTQSIGKGSHPLLLHPVIQICIATLPWIALLALSVSIELVPSSARVISVKYQQGIVCESVTDTLTHRYTWVR